MLRSSATASVCISCLSSVLTLGCIAPDRSDVAPAVAVTSAALVIDPNEQWFPIGPAPISGLITDRIAPGQAVGRATALAVNPLNTDEVWVGTAAGGVWRTDNATAPEPQWVPVTDGLGSMVSHHTAAAIGAILLDESSCTATRCDRLWIGTGENAIRRQTYYGAGLFQLDYSHDEFDVPIYTRLPLDPGRFEGGAINNIARTQAGSLFMTVSAGNTSSAHAATVFHPPPAGNYGVHKSTDTGNTWTRVNVPRSAPASEDLPTDLEQADTAADPVLLAGFMNRGVFFSALDGTATEGETWCPLTPGAGTPAGCQTPMVTCTTGSTIGGLPSAAEMTSLDHVEIAVFDHTGQPDVVYA